MVNILQLISAFRHFISIDIPESQIRKRISQVRKAKKLIADFGRFELMRDSLHGQSLSELIDLPTTFKTGDASRTTVYIHSPRRETLHAQLRAISLQTIAPEAIVIYMYDLHDERSDILAEIQRTRHLFPDGMIQVVTTSESFRSHGRFECLLKVLLAASRAVICFGTPYKVYGSADRSTPGSSTRI